MATTKIHPKDHIDIAIARIRGEPQASIASRYGVQASTISNLESRNECIVDLTAEQILTVIESSDSVFTRNCLVRML